jgi:lipopolysaccharide export LptBFGC system permease protein LptF
MSRFVWNFLGGCTVLAGILLLNMGQERRAELPPDEHHNLIWMLVLFEVVLASIAIACFFPKSHKVTLRIIGAIGVIGCVFNLVQGFHQRDFSQYPTSFLWLLPSLYLLWRGDLGQKDGTLE